MKKQILALSLVFAAFSFDGQGAEAAQPAPPLPLHLACICGNSHQLRTSCDEGIVRIYNGQTLNANRCVYDCHCDVGRTCSFAGWCH